MAFMPFDTETDLVGQGLKSDSYDMIAAVSVSLTKLFPSPALPECLDEK